MQAYVFSKPKHCRVSLSPAATKAPEDQALRFFSTPGHFREERHRGVKLVRRRIIGRNTVKDDPDDDDEEPVEKFDILSFVRSLRSSELTDRQAEFICSPFHGQRHSQDVIATALVNRLTSSVKEVEWNTPVVHQEWEDDLRFLGEWWLSLRDREAEATENARTELQTTSAEEHLPWLEPEERSTDSENQLLADITQRLHGRLFRLALLHVDELHLTPDRMHILVFDGLVRRKFTGPVPSFDHILAAPVRAPAARLDATFFRDPLAETRCGTSVLLNGPPVVALPDLRVLSLSMCGVSAASLLILLAGLVTLNKVDPPIEVLDISFNCVRSRTLYTLVSLLPYTSISKLSLRGNHLAGKDTVALRDFLLEGASEIEELDLSYTHLNDTQVGILISCLPDMVKLRILLLDGVLIDGSKLAAFGRAVYQSQIIRVSTNGSISGKDKNFFRDMLDKACEHNRKKVPGESWVGTATTSFFELFFEKSKKRGFCPPTEEGLPAGYREFITNDPTLFDFQ